MKYVVDLKRSEAAIADMPHKRLCVTFDEASVTTDNPATLMLTVDRTKADRFLTTGWQIVASRTVPDAAEII